MTDNIPKEDWMQKKWRPMMAIMYMLVCICDFVIFPVLWSILQSVNQGQVSTQWQPITLQGAGLFHMAMGAVLGVAAWSRGQEKMAGVTTSSMMPTRTSIVTTRGFNGTSSRPSQPYQQEI